MQPFTSISFLLLLVLPLQVGAPGRLQRPIPVPKTPHIVPLLVEAKPGTTARFEPNHLQQLPDRRLFELLLIHNQMVLTAHLERARVPQHPHQSDTNLLVQKIVHSEPLYLLDARFERLPVLDDPALNHDRTCAGQCAFAGIGLLLEICSCQKGVPRHGVVQE